MKPRTIRVETTPPYEVHVGPEARAKLGPCCAEFSASIVLTDARVERLCERFAFPKAGPRLVVPEGERSKSLAELERVLDFMVAQNLDRRSCLIAIGGGVVGDLGGLAAALYMRGIALVQVPTTLLAQVDSSVGGKTAINLAGGKNLAGAFHQPRAVVADTSVLASLSTLEYGSGLGEVLKTALLDGEECLTLLERESEAIRERDPEILAEIVARCVRLKAGIVARDPHEQNERKALNLGHTFAHGIEHEAGYGRVPHGLAVAVGLTLALRASAELGVLRDAALPERVERLLVALALPANLTQLRAQQGTALSVPGLLAGLRHDKKGAAGDPRFVLLERAGTWKLDVPLPRPLLERMLERSGARASP